LNPRKYVQPTKDPDFKDPVGIKTGGQSIVRVQTTQYKRIKSFCPLCEAEGIRDTQMTWMEVFQIYRCKFCGYEIDPLMTKDRPNPHQQLRALNEEHKVKIFVSTPQNILRRRLAKNKPEDRPRVLPIIKFNSMVDAMTAGLDPENAI
jgi:hypothetical protein